MATECDTTGVIVKTSKSSCVVSVTIDGTPKSFHFSKANLYSFGEKCEGDMTNLLEDDMEVDVSYKVRPGGPPAILAVWLGEKPVVSGKEDLTPIYDRKGVIKEIYFDDYVAHSADGKVLVDRKVVYRDNWRCPTIAEDEEICFDAVPLHDIHVTGALYNATCAWIGPTPRVVDRFNLQVQEFDVEFSDIVDGTVGVIPNETLALVEVDQMLTRVLLFRSSFQPLCERIHDAVDIGDKLFMRVSYGYVFRGRKQWFAQVASKDSDDDCFRRSETLNVVETASYDSDTGSTAARTNAVRRPVETASYDSDTGSTAARTNVVRRPVETASYDSDTSSTAAVTGDILPPVETRTKTPVAGPKYNKNSKYLYDDPPLTGVISKFLSYGRIKYGKLNVLVDLSNFYAKTRSIKRADFNSYIASGENIVNFEAVLMKREGSEFSEFSHEAICAWVKKKPCLTIIAMSLPRPKLDLLEEKNQIFYGIVAKICFPGVALATIPELSTTVCMHCYSFVTKPRSKKDRLLICNYVQVGDCVSFKLIRIESSPQFLWSREAVHELSKEISDLVASGSLSRMPGGPSKKPKVVKPVPQRTPSECSKVVEPVPQRTPSECSKVVEPVPQRTPSECSTDSSRSSLEPGVCVASPFKNGCLSRNRAYLLNCTGTIKTCYDENLKTAFVRVDHAFGSSKLSGRALYIRKGKAQSVESIASLDNHQVRFDAEKTMSANSNCYFVVTKMWDVCDTRPPSEILLYSDLRLFEGLSTESCPGKITSIPLHDTAIATVKNVHIMVPFESLVSLEKINLARSSIDTFLNVGDFVGLRFQKRKFQGELSGSYFRAVSCWSLHKGGEEINYDDQIRICVPRINSWFSKWGYGAFSCTGTVMISENEYCVHHHFKRLGLSLELNIFGKGQVFVGGHLVKDQSRAVKDKQITYHVAHGYVEKVSDDKSREMFKPKSVFVACSWIGKEPSAEAILKDKLAVQKGSVCSNWCYEMVVDSFPLPTHAICRLGHVPVLVPLPQLTQNEAFVGVKNVNLKRGDRIVARVLEDCVGDTTVLICNDSALKEVGEVDDKDLLKNVSGTVEKLPNPTGLIRAFNSGALVTVSFELCHVRRFKKSPGSDKAWFDTVKGRITLGKKVFFSAFRVNTKTAPYRAFEVYFK